MQVITAPEQVVLDIAGLQKCKNTQYRFLKWTIFIPYDDGVVVNNYMSGELIYISLDEFKKYMSNAEFSRLADIVRNNSKGESFTTNAISEVQSLVSNSTIDGAEKDVDLSEHAKKKPFYVDADIKTVLNNSLAGIDLNNSQEDELLQHLLKNWFTVPIDFDEKKLVEELRLACKLINQKRGVTSYKILTTTRCNARCFYCYEHGIRYSDMTEETANKVVDYIASHHNGRQVTLSWFGGEPLMRPDIIDIICDGLKSRNIEYASVMISNGYIFNDELVDRAKNKWNLRNIQITLDGTRDVYNRAKNYYSENDKEIYNYAGDYVNEAISSQPYDRVIRNIHKLVDNDIKVNIRLNLGAYNYDDLDELIDTLAKEYSDKHGVTAYVGGLFEEMEQEESLKRDLVNNIIKLSDKLHRLGLGSYTKSGLKLRITGCMADNDNHRGFSPDGVVIKCEHFIEDKTIGHVDNDNIDMDVLNEWKEREVEGTECNDCQAYPACYKLKNCPVSHACSLSERDEFLSQNKRTILHEISVAEAHKNRENDASEELQNC